ncbi:MAG: hypothetical protein OEZ51_10070 [Nitrospinota bacterium]|nr:hypothetical protein [Nitrospinota bacterium]
MEILFESNFPKNPKVSFILLDWSCRESFHLFHYLNQQNVPRNSYEIIWIEYYGRRSTEIRKRLEDTSPQSKPPILDQWIIMDMPETLYYHKHLMYNVGIVLSKGEIITICDSDAMVRPTFVETIIKSFEANPNIALHMDEVRNNDQRFHPFNYPTFDEVEGEGAINFKNGTTTGLLDTEDPLHTLNYGACLCARREDLISIGGSDEHLDYLGHVCGPYELTFRLKNLGRQEVWHPAELLYHVWHPGQAGDGNYVGPHDGRHMSSTALEAVESGRIQPLLENQAVAALRKNKDLDPKSLIPKLIDPSYLENWTYEAMAESTSFYVWETAELVDSVFHYNIVKHMGRFYALPQALGPVDLNKKEEREHPDILVADTMDEIKKSIELQLKDQEGRYADDTSHARSSFGGRVFDQLRKLSSILQSEPSSTETPSLLTSHRGYNLVHYGGKLYGIPQSLGAMDLSEQNMDSLPEEIMISSSLEDMKSCIDQLRNMPEGQVILEYENFNIIKWGELLYGVPHFFGPVDQSTAESEEGSLFPKASTLKIVKERINQFHQSTAPTNDNWEFLSEENLNQPFVLTGVSIEDVKNLIEWKCQIKSEPELLEEMKGYNIIKFKNRFWGIPQALGGVNLMKEKNLNHPSIVSADNLEDLKTGIENALEYSKAPEIITEWNEYNIFKYKKQFWGIPQTLGEVDLTIEKNLEKPSIITAQSLDEVKNSIDAAVGMKAAPEFLETWYSYNLIKYKNIFWGIPHSLGEVNLTEPTALKNPSLLSAPSLDEIKNQIDETVGLSQPPELLEEWNQHNILRYQNRFWGVPQNLGALDLTEKKSRENSSLVSADSLVGVKNKIDEVMGLTLPPELIESWNKHNILKYQNQFWGVPHNLGAVDLTEPQSLENPSLISANSVEIVKTKIDEVVGLTLPPELIESWNKHNIMKYQNRFWGVPHNLGAVDLRENEIPNNSSILSADSINEVKILIDKAVAMQAPPEFLEEYHTHNILEFRNRFWGIPIELGEIDLTKEEHANHPSILLADTLDDVKNKIEMVVGWSAPPEFMGEMNGYNLIKYRNRFYGIPQDLGEVKLTQK